MSGRSSAASFDRWGGVAALYDDRNDGLPFGVNNTEAATGGSARPHWLARSSLQKRCVSRRTVIAFAIWTGLFWGGVAVFGALFFVGVLDFTTSAKAALYGISVWLNGCIIPVILRACLGDRVKRAGGSGELDSWRQTQHECLSLWYISYAMTNLLWEIPWIIASPFVFRDITTLEQVVEQTPWMRESVLHMYYWILSAFASVDLRTVNHNATFYTLELYSFLNVAVVCYFFYLNRRRSRNRYLVPILASGEPIVATFIFSISQVFAGFEDMPGGTADTLLALVWTQYQYILFPCVFGLVGCRLLRADWQACDAQADIF